MKFKAGKEELRTSAMLQLLTDLKAGTPDIHFLY